MRFFLYNDEVVNLTHITNFSAYQRHIPHEGQEELFTLMANLHYSLGVTEETNVPAAVELGKFESQNDALEAVKDILAGVYDLPTVQALQPRAYINENESQSATTEEVEEVTAEEVETEPAETQDDRPLEKIIEDTRELYRLTQTENICKELGIKKERVYSEAQRIFGKPDTWTKDTWKNYFHAIADFQQRKGTLYTALKPSNGTNNTKSNGEGPF